MLDLVSVLARPIAKLLLKSWLGETAAAAGDNLFKLAFDRLGDRDKARAAQRRADAIATAVVRDLERFFATERVDEAALESAAFELGETIAAHVDSAFLVHQKLNAAEIRKGLLAARPVAGIYRRQEPEHGLYVRLVEALAPRLRAVAPELPGYTLERDAELLERMAWVADDAQHILAEIKATREETARTRELVEKGDNRQKTKRSHYRDNYRKVIHEALDYVDILGLDVERARREVKLSIAYLSLTTNVAGLGRIDFETLLDLLR